MKLKLTLPKKKSEGSHVQVKEPAYRKSDPARIWHMLLAVAGFLLLISLAFHFFVYKKVNEGTFAATEGETGSQKLNASKLSYILSYFEERTRSYESEKLTPPIVSDPSL